MTAKIIELPGVTIQCTTPKEKLEELTLVMNAAHAAKLKAAGDLAGCRSDAIANRILNFIVDRLSPQALVELAQKCCSTSTPTKPRTTA